MSLDRAGHTASMPGFGAGNFGAFKLSPSGDKLAIIVSDATSDLWVYDLARGTRTRLNTTANSGHPLWTPDGKWVTFDSFVRRRLERLPAAGRRFRAAEPSGLERQQSDPVLLVAGWPGSGLYRSESDHEK